MSAYDPRPQPNVNPMYAVTTEPTTEAGRALLDGLERTIQGMFTRGLSDDERADWTRGILAIENEARAEGVRVTEAMYGEQAVMAAMQEEPTND
jgi:hypothetical protein